MRSALLAPLGLSGGMSPLPWVATHNPAGFSCDVVLAVVRVVEILFFYVLDLERGGPHNFENSKHAA